MSSDVAISVEKVSKAYRIWENPAARITVPIVESLAQVMPGGVARALRQRAASRYRDFWALKDINFTVRKGEAVGIIGRNGSGKSTLLQLIAGTLQATTGSARVKGRVAALLELGSGFNPEFTGRENVFLNGAVLGFSHAEMNARFEDIAAFADIGDFIDQPVKTYSSGMMMRLAFSVQTAVDPEILIVDEALSVGDAQFVAKCIKRVSDFLSDGGTLLFVSHDIGLIKQLTTRALYLDKGHQIAFDETVAVSLAYSEALSAMNNGTQTTDPDRYSAPNASYKIGATLVSRDGLHQADVFSPGESALITINLELGPRGSGHLVFSIYNYLGLIVCSGMYELPVMPTSSSNLRVQLKLPHLRLAPGHYRMNFAVRNKLEILSWARNAISFMITGDTTETYIYREDTIVSFDFS